MCWCSLLHWAMIVRANLTRQRGATAELTEGFTVTEGASQLLEREDDGRPQDRPQFLAPRKLPAFSQPSASIGAESAAMRDRPHDARGADVPQDADHIEDHDRGLAFDLPRLISRRRAVSVLAGSIGTGVLAACGASSDGGASAGTSTATAADGGTTATTTAAAAVGEIADETAGPYPGDGSNGPNVLAESGVVRSDITKSIGDASGVAEGVPATVELTLIDVAGGGRPLAGAAVYLWHCDASGRYSLYDQGVTGENYLRGVQATGSDGKLAFKTIFPAAYSGRWPHIHFEIYESVKAATSAGSKLKTSQLAIPQAACDAVYATAGYEQSVQNLAQTSLETDMVFSDGFAGQLATASGNAKDGYTLKLNVGV